MSEFESVNKLVKEWQPRSLPTELEYRNSLTSFLRQRLPAAPFMRSMSGDFLYSLLDGWVRQD